MQQGPYGIDSSPLRWAQQVEGKGRLVVQGFQEEQFSLTLYGENCYEGSWVWWWLQLVPYIQYFLNFLVFLWAWRVTFLSLVASVIYLVYWRAPRVRHQERQQRRAAKATKLKGSTKAEQRWSVVVYSKIQDEKDRRKAEAIRDLWSAWARLSNTLRSHRWERLRKARESILGKTNPKRGPSARARVPF